MRPTEGRGPLEANDVRRRGAGPLGPQWPAIRIPHHAERPQHASPFRIALPHRPSAPPYGLNVADRTS